MTRGWGCDMTKKKSPDAKRPSSKTTKATRLKKAQPPPDDPLLRAEMDKLSHGGGDVKEMARARARALEKKE